MATKRTKVTNDAQVLARLEKEAGPVVLAEIEATERYLERQAGALDEMIAAAQEALEYGSL